MTLNQSFSFWTLLGIAFLLVAIGCNEIEPSFVTFRVILISLGFLFVLSGFNLAFDQRNKSKISNGSLALATFGLCLAFCFINLSLDKSWDSLITASRIFAMVTFCLTGFILLPLGAKKITAAFLLLFHFAGIISAVTSLEPPGAPASWVATNLWAFYFRHYLTFTYMNNAYHFYSPEPGPPTLIWSKIQYEDGSFLWFKIPSREESPIQMHYQRMLSITESHNMATNQTPDNWDERLQKRNLVGLAHQPQILPLNRTMSQSSMYKEPTEYSKKMVSSFALYLTKKFAHPDKNPQTNIESIKIYKVTHGIITASDLARGEGPLDPTLFYPYFIGSFDKKGNLIDPNDPFLYFLLPINRSTNPNEPAVLTDSLKIHAGDIKINAGKEGDN